MPSLQNAWIAKRVSCINIDENIPPPRQTKIPLILHKNQPIDLQPIR